MADGSKEQMLDGEREIDVNGSQQRSTKPGPNPCMKVAAWFVLILGGLASVACVISAIRDFS